MKQPANPKLPKPALVARSMVVAEPVKEEPILIPQLSVVETVAVAPVEAPVVQTPEPEPEVAILAKGLEPVVFGRLAEEEVDYKTHEYPNVLTVKTDGKKSTINQDGVDMVLNELSRASSVEDLLLKLEFNRGALEATDNVLLVQPAIITQAIEVSGGFDPRRVVTDYFAQGDVADAGIDLDNSVIGLTTISYTPWGFSSSEDLPAIEEKINKAVTLNGVWESLKLLRGKLRRYYFEELERSVTELCNEYLAMVIQADYTIESFVLDFEEWRKQLHIDDYAMLNKDLLNELRSTILCTYRPVLDDELVGGSEGKFLATVEEIVLLPITAAELDLRCKTVVGVITQEKTPALYNTATKMLDVRRSYTRYVRIVTADNQSLYLRRVGNLILCTAKRSF